MGLTLGVGVRHSNPFFAILDFTDLHAQLDFEALLCKGFVRFLGHLLVHRAQKNRQAFEDGDFSAQAAPDGTHFQADHARTNQAQLFGHSANVQCAIVGEHIDFIKRCSGQSSRVGAGRDDDLLAGDGFFSGTCYLDFICAFCSLHEGATAMEEGDFVLLEQIQDTVVVLLHDGVLAGQHFGHIHAHACSGNAMFCKVMVGVVKVFARLQQGLGWNAAHIGTGTAGGRTTLVVFPLVDAGDVKAQLRRADGRNVSTRTATNDDHVKLFTHVALP